MFVRCNNSDSRHMITASRILRVTSDPTMRTYFDIGLILLAATVTCWATPESEPESSHEPAPAHDSKDGISPLLSALIYGALLLLLSLVELLVTLLLSSDIIPEELLDLICLPPIPDHLLAFNYQPAHPIKIIPI